MDKQYWTYIRMDDRCLIEAHESQKTMLQRYAQLCMSDARTIGYTTRKISLDGLFDALRNGHPRCNTPIIQVTGETRSQPNT